MEAFPRARIGGAGAADDDVSGRHADFHVVDVFPERDVPVVGGIDAEGLQFLRDILAVLAVCVDEVEFFVVFFFGDEFTHRVVDGIRSKASAHGEDEDAVIGDAQFFAALRAVGRDHLAADRQAGDDRRVLALDAFLGVFGRQHDDIDHFGKGFIGDARVGVLLMDRSRNAQFRGGPDDRSAHVAAKADGGIGLVFFDEFFRLDAGREHLDQRGAVSLDVVPGEAAVKAADVDRREIESGLRDQSRLHMGRGPDEEDLDLVAVLFTDLPRHSQRRVDVSAGTTGRK